MELTSLAQLERSHRRHDEVLAVLLEAARRFAAGRPDPDDHHRVEDALRYFERAVPRHFLDEEASVFPRLAAHRPDLAAELTALAAEHPAQLALQQAVATAAHGLDDQARPGAGKALLEAAELLAAAHHAHVAREDALLRAATGALTAQDDQEITREMEGRRERGGGGGGGGGGRGGGGGGGRGPGGGGGRGPGGGGGRGPGGGGGGGRGPGGGGGGGGRGPGGGGGRGPG